MPLPVGFSGDFSGVGSYEQLMVSNMFSTDQFLIIGAFPGSLLDNLDTIWASTEDSVRTNAESFQSTYAVEASELVFMGEQLAGKTFRYIGSDGVGTGLVSKYFYRLGGTGYEVTIAVSQEDIEREQAQKLTELLARAEVVPLWIHKSHKGFGLEFPSPQLRLAEPEGELVIPGVFTLESDKQSVRFWADQLGDWAASEADLTGALLQVQNGLTSARDLGVTQEVELDCIDAKFTTRGSLKLDGKPLGKAYYLMNTDPNEDFSASILVDPPTESFSRSGNLMVHNVFQNPSYVVHDFQRIQRSILGQSTTGQRFTYGTPRGESKLVQEAYSIPIAEGVLELVFWYTSAAGSLGATQADLFLDNLERAK